MRNEKTYILEVDGEVIIETPSLAQIEFFKQYYRGSNVVVIAFTNLE